MTCSPRRKRWIAAACVSALAICAALLLQAGPESQPAAAAPPEATPGALDVINEKGETVGLCPLKHTDVHARVSGYVARVEVTQEFQNPYKEKIEAVYTFPLSQNAAVDDMLMKVGERTIRGVIKQREEARRIYEAARAKGNVASLLEQDRPNIFTQSVANIMPGENVTITIRYVETLKYEDAWFEFVFPTVVGPRYIPGEATSSQPEVAPEMKGRVVQPDAPQGKDKPSGTGWSPDTTQVPDASRITPPVTLPDTRAGHDISIDVDIDAGAPLSNVESVLHDVTIKRSDTQAHVRLKDKATIPNKDFILRYTTAGKDIGDAVLTHASDLGRFVTLILQPPERVRPEQITPKEMVFVIDTSGSMSGQPIEKAKQTMFHCLDNLNPQDTFNLITFSGETRVLYPQPVPATPTNVGQASELLASLKGSGGTEMMKAVVAALQPSDAQDHVRIVCFMTDGFVGNDMAIIDEIQRHPNARVFSFGVGQSVNRFLLDNMAQAGRGEVQYVTLGTDGEQVAKTFYDRLRNPVLTDIALDWGDLPIADAYPERVPDLFSSKPVVLHARYTGKGKGEITLTGKVAGKPFERHIPISLPAEQGDNEVLGSLWARARVEHLMNQDWSGIQRGSPRTETKDAIVDLGLRFGLVTQYTSFVAVEEMVITEGGEPRTIAVPVEMPEGVTYEGVFGGRGGSRGKAGVSVNFAYQGARTVAAPAGAAGPPGAMGAPVDGRIQFRAEPLAESEAAIPDSIDAVKAADMKPEERRARLLDLKLAPEFHGLAKKVADEGHDGNLTVGDIVVKGGKVEVSVWLTDDSAENLAKLKKLGFVELARSRAVKMTIGRIDVSKLEDLALLDFVSRVDPGPK